jgi:ATP-dependent RNA helicase DHX37/DHR1
VFNDQFEQFAAPETQRKPVNDVLLQMKAMNIDKGLYYELSKRM